MPGNRAGLTGQRNHLCLVAGMPIHALSLRVVWSWSSRGAATSSISDSLSSIGSFRASQGLSCCKKTRHEASATPLLPITNG